MRLRALVPVALLAGGAAAPAADWQCPALSPSRSEQPVYTAATNRAQCEGFFEQPVSVPYVELVSLTLGAARLDSAVPTTFAQSSAPAARLLIQPLAGTPLYRVDAELKGRQPTTWDPRPMLARTHLQAGDLGFLALLPDDVAAILQVAPLTLAASASATAFATVRTSVDLSALKWRSFVRGKPAAVAWQISDKAALYAWETLSMALALPPGGAGLQVDVVATDTDKNVLPMLSFVVLPVAP
ncbi:MAG: hypothetical protein ABJD97_03820 [Betaproteobacteria bacterium]